MEEILERWNMTLLCCRYVILGWLLWVLTQKVTFLPPHKEDLQLGQFLKSGRTQLPTLIVQ
jgi:hypothetical protein